MASNQHALHPLSPTCCHVIFGWKPSLDMVAGDLFLMYYSKVLLYLLLLLWTEEDQTIYIWLCRPSGGNIWTTSQIKFSCLCLCYRSSVEEGRGRMWYNIGRICNYVYLKLSSVAFFDHCCTVLLWLTPWQEHFFFFFKEVCCNSLVKSHLLPSD